MKKRFKWKQKTEEEEEAKVEGEEEEEDDEEVEVQLRVEETRSEGKTRSDFRNLFFSTSSSSLSLAIVCSFFATSIRGIVSHRIPSSLDHREYARGSYKSSELDTHDVDQLRRCKRSGSVRRRRFLPTIPGSAGD